MKNFSVTVLAIAATAAVALTLLAAGCGGKSTDTTGAANADAAQTNAQPTATKTTTSGTTTSRTNTKTTPTDQSGTSTQSSALPTTVGACSTTTVAEIGYRLVGTPGSGSAIRYANGGYQVSYDTVASVQDWRAGDPVELCLVSIPQNCPPGDNRGKVYNATNLRTGESWEAQDSQHSCGGA